MGKVCEFANLACDSFGPNQPFVFLFSSLFPTGVAATSTTIVSHSFLLFQTVFVTVLASTSTYMSFTNLRQQLSLKFSVFSLFLSSISKDLQMTKIFKSIWLVFKYLNDFRYYIKIFLKKVFAKHHTNLRGITSFFLLHKSFLGYFTPNLRLGMAMGRSGAERWGLRPYFAWFCFAPFPPCPA